MFDVKFSSSTSSSNWPTEPAASTVSPPNSCDPIERRSKVATLPAGPSHREFLSSRDVGLIELEAHATDRPRLIEDQPDPLYARRSSAPAGSCSEIENSFN